MDNKIDKRVFIWVYIWIEKNKNIILEYIKNGLKELYLKTKINFKKYIHEII